MHNDSLRNPPVRVPPWKISETIENPFSLWKHTAYESVRSAEDHLMRPLVAD